NVFEQVEIDQDTKNSELNQSQTCHSSAAYGELPFNLAVVLFPELTKLPTTLSNIFKNNGFSVQNQLILPFSTDFDHVNCASVDDFNLDGKTEIILGTFGQRLLYYEWELNNTDPKSGQFILKFQRSLPGPVFCISPALDLIGEGPLSLAVLTSRGLHIFQHDTYCLIKEIHHRLDNHSPLILNL
ncbi:unnamed protein product, partial [Schistosoma mattheei]